MHPVAAHPWAGLFSARDARSHRSSSWDRTGANQDFIRIGPGETAVLLDVEGAGCVMHLYCALVLPDLTEYRDAILRCYWDGSDTPSVEVPLGDFFGIAHARIREFTSLAMAVNPGVGGTHGLNCYFPMPYADGARITLENRGGNPLGGVLGAFWFHVDCERYEVPPPAGTYRFHAGYRQERPTTAVGDEPNVTLHGATNLTGADNYLALDTAGTGRMVGLLLEVRNRQGQTWYGEGDDMVFIDGERWPPSIHGTGTEEIFGGGACPATEYAGPYTGFHLIESPRFDGLIGMYRWYLSDPIHFATGIRWSIEHGHANNFANDYASVAYWYQEPLATLPPLPAAVDLRPPLGADYQQARDRLFEAVGRAIGPGRQPTDLFAVAAASTPFYRGDFSAALGAFDG
jgi:D-arabinan exo alpha-(1,3)/(1,5)-arabinofuranosidase (non-reducing end)